jgi:hypothetical protein
VWVASYIKLWRNLVNASTNYQTNTKPFPWYNERTKAVVKVKPPTLTLNQINKNSTIPKLEIE